MVQLNSHNIVQVFEGFHLDIFETFLDPQTDQPDEAPVIQPSRTYGVSDNDRCTKRIEGSNYAPADDDGGVRRNSDVADLMLVGVLRSGKIPTCLYLAPQYVMDTLTDAVALILGRKTLSTASGRACRMYSLLSMPSLPRSMSIVRPS